MAGHVTETVAPRKNTPLPGGVTVIYGLVDPRNSELRYVGKTSWTPEKRFFNHLSRHSRAHCKNWIKNLKEYGLVPEMVEIETVGIGRWQEAERFWIAYFRSIGARLTNHTPGGEGEGKACTAEHKRRIGDGNRGKVRSPEVRKRMAEGRKGKGMGRIWSPESLAKISNTKKVRHLQARDVERGPFLWDM